MSRVPWWNASNMFGRSGRSAPLNQPNSAPLPSPMGTQSALVETTLTGGVQ